MELSQENRYVVRCFETNFIEQGKKKIILYWGSIRALSWKHLKNPALLD